MKDNGLKVTDRLKRVFDLAEREADELHCTTITPALLLSAFLQERTGILGELYLHVNADTPSLKNAIAKSGKQTSAETFTRSTFFHMPVENSTEMILTSAIKIMDRYNQVVLNEGHVLKALIQSNCTDDLLSEEDKVMIEKLGTVPRDLIAWLGCLTPDKAGRHNIRRVSRADRNRTIQFVSHHFTNDWVKTIEKAFEQSSPPVYIALNNKKEIIGFAAYDVYKNKKCYFGPMGVAKGERTKGAGYDLLHRCLADMKTTGYEYAIIAEAGPVEFYEKACKAVAIPVFQER